VFAPPEVAIVEGVGELEAQLADFFAAHYERLVGLAGLVCHSPTTIEDAVQAAMEQAWRRRATLLDPLRLKPWLDQIVVREAIRLNRKPWWSRLLPADDEAVERISDGGADIDPSWIALADAFRRLPTEQRAAVALHLYAGYSVDETAELTGASLETTRSRLRLARRRLRRELSEDDR
jgi:RNA polymerase sigma factor (sigma-70 family)